MAGPGGHRGGHGGCPGHGGMGHGGMGHGGMGPGPMGPGGGFGHRPMPPHHGMGPRPHRHYRGGCSGCLIPVIGVMAAIGLLLGMIF